MLCCVWLRDKFYLFIKSNDLNERKTDCEQEYYIPGIVTTTFFLHCNNNTKQKTLNLPHSCMYYWTTHIVIRLWIYSTEFRPQKRKKQKYFFFSRNIYWTAKITFKIKMQNINLYSWDISLNKFYYLLPAHHNIHFNFDWLFHLERIYCLFSFWMFF